MGKIVVSENVSLDGVFEDPAGEEGLGRGAWLVQLSEKDRAAWAEVLTAEALGAEALLLGRRSYEFLAGRYPSRAGEWADKLNSMPKYVVSTTLENPAWTNSTVISVDAVAKLKREVEGDIVVYASGQLLPALMAHVDEFRLMTFPLVLGSGRRLFGETSAALRLVETRVVGDDLALHTYRR